VAGILRPADTEPELREIPNDPQHVRRLFTRLTREGSVNACYEAGVSGYDLYRRLTALGVACEVIAPASTPRRPGQRVKTDRRDAAKLVRLFRAGELTAIHVPDETEEAGRDLVCCRDDIRRDVRRWRHRVLKLLVRYGRVYLAGKNWSQAHWRWIPSQQFEQPPLQRAFEASLFALEQALVRRAEPARNGLTAGPSISASGFSQRGRRNRSINRSARDSCRARGGSRASCRPGFVWPRS
jgi:transposase